MTRILSAIMLLALVSGGLTGCIFEEGGHRGGGHHHFFR